jgi:hypothetical protein
MLGCVRQHRGTDSEGLEDKSDDLQCSETQIRQDEKTGTMVKIRECTGQ